MKTKRILSLTLMFIMLLSVNVFAGANKIEVSKDNVGVAYKDAVKVAYHLGYMPNIYRDAKKYVTAGGVTELLVRLNGYEDQVELRMADAPKLESVAHNTIENGFVNTALTNSLISVLNYKSDYYSEVPEGWANERLLNVIEEGKRVPVFSSAPMTYEALARLVYTQYLTKNIWVRTGWGAIEENWFDYHKKTDETFLSRMGYTQADIDKALAMPDDAPVYADEYIPRVSILLAIGDTNAILNGTVVANDVAPKIVNGRTMLPIRFVAESLGAEVKWNGDTRTVSISTKGGTIAISLKVGEDKARVSGKTVTLDTPSFVENGRTYLPVRFVSESLGAEVNWNNELRQVTITK